MLNVFNMIWKVGGSGKRWIERGRSVKWCHLIVVIKLMECYEGG